MISESPRHGVAIVKGMLPQENMPQRNPRTGVVSVESTRGRRGDGVHDSLIGHRQRLAGALEAAVTGAGAAENRRVH